MITHNRSVTLGKYKTKANKPIYLHCSPNVFIYGRLSLSELLLALSIYTKTDTTGMCKLAHTTCTLSVSIVQ